MFGLKTEFFNEYDQSEFQVSFRTAPDASIEETRGRVELLVGEFRKVPEVEHTYATIGAGDAGTVRDGLIYVKLKEKKDRERSQARIQRQVREILLGVPGIVPSVEEVGRLTGRSR